MFSSSEAVRYTLEKEMATHSSILAWKILQTEELIRPWHEKSEMQLSTHACIST